MSLALGWLYVVLAAGLHECGHALACLLCGLKVKRFGVSRKGFYTVREASASPPINGCIAAAGPLVNLLSVALWPMAPGFAAISLMLGVVVLMPVKNSDGSKLMAIWR
jgi:membrane-associated protease RseP (regulator of RpoE activity)